MNTDFLFAENPSLSFFNELSNHLVCYNGKNEMCSGVFICQGGKAIAKTIELFSFLLMEFNFCGVKYSLEIDRFR